MHGWVFRFVKKFSQMMMEKTTSFVVSCDSTFLNLTYVWIDYRSFCSIKLEPSRNHQYFRVYFFYFIVKPMPRKTVRRKGSRRSTGLAGYVEPGYGAILVRTMWMKKFKEQGRQKPKSLRKHHMKQTKKRRKRLRSTDSVIQRTIRRFSEKTRPSSY